MSGCLKFTIVILGLVGAVGLLGILVVPELSLNWKPLDAVNDLIATMPFLKSAAVITALSILVAGCLLSLLLCSNRVPWSAPLAMLAATILLTVFAASFRIQDINPYIGYGSVCAEVPESDRVVTLFVKRSENMKVYLHRDVVRYEKDVDAFLEGEAGTTEPSTLIVTTSRIAENPPLQNFIRTRAHSTVKVGDYSVIEY